MRVSLIATTNWISRLGVHASLAMRISASDSLTKDLASNMLLDAGLYDMADLRRAKIHVRNAVNTRAPRINLRFWRAEIDKYFSNSHISCRYFSSL